jgi:hypothetical protein
MKIILLRGFSEAGGKRSMTSDRGGRGIGGK